MKFFIDEEQRKSTNSTGYFEFQKGHFQDKFWLSDSICIDASLWDEFCLSDLIASGVDDFDYYGTTEISVKQWKAIEELCLNSNKKGCDVLLDANEWIDDCFNKHDAFTIIGL